MVLTRRGFTGLAALAVGMAAAGCTSDSNGAGGSAEGGSFTYWSMWEEGEDQQEVLASEIEKFTADTGIEVDVQWVGREVITQLVPRLNAGNPPDLVDQTIDYVARVGLENLIDLTSLYGMDIPGEAGKKISDVIPESVMPWMKKDNGEIYLAPYEIIGVTMWFNGAVTPGLEEATPKTWDEFIAVLDDLKANGRTPLALDGDIVDYCGFWVESAVLRAGGPGVLIDAVRDTTGEKFHGPAWVAATDAVEQLLAGGYFPDGFRGTKYPTQQAGWADQSNETDLILMGSWAPSEAAGALEKSGQDYAGTKFTSFPFPSIGENLGSDIVLAQPLGFAIPQKARKADAAKQFIAYFTAKERIGRIASEAKNLTPRTDIEVPEELSAFNEEYKNAAKVVLFLDGVGIHEPKWLTDIWQPALGKLFDRNITAGEFRQELQDKTVGYHKNG